MSKRKKGVSLEEKRERILKIYHESKDVFNLKEIEKLASKAGVVLQTIKDVNQSLIDDGLVDTEKIGSGNYFWSFPSKISQQKRNKLNKLNDRINNANRSIEENEKLIIEQKESRQDTSERKDNLLQLTELNENINNLEKKLSLLSENDPAILDNIEKSIKVAKQATDRWTDNIFGLKSWIIQKRNCPSSEVDKWLGIQDDFDYIEI